MDVHRGWAGWFFLINAIFIFFFFFWIKREGYRDFLGRSWRGPQGGILAR